MSLWISLEHCRPIPLNLLRAFVEAESVNVGAMKNAKFTAKNDAAGSQPAAVACVVAVGNQPKLWHFAVRFNELAVATEATEAANKIVKAVPQIARCNMGDCHIGNPFL
jgi:mannose/fructose/N-acetylgalactosamine-specific phosphotransferase system component IIB